jgi:hypothetical protein
MSCPLTLSVLVVQEIPQIPIHEYVTMSSEKSLIESSPSREPAQLKVVVQWLSLAIFSVMAGSQKSTKLSVRARDAF